MKNRILYIKILNRVYYFSQLAIIKNIIYKLFNENYIFFVYPNKILSCKIIKIIRI